MNPINALHISLTLGAKGRIFRTDDALAAILGYDCTNRLFGTEIHRLIPELRVINFQKFQEINPIFRLTWT